MGELHKCDVKLCNKCIYRMRFGFASYNAKISHNVACNYAGITQNIRVWNPDGTRKIEKGYCDKFVEGEALTPKREWSSDAMTIRSQRKRRTDTKI